MEYKPKHTLRGQHKSPITCIEFSPTGLRVASGDQDGFLIVWSVESGNVLWTCQGHSALLAMRWVRSHEGEELIFGGYMDGTLVIIDLTQESSSIVAYRALDSPVECMALQETFSFLALGGGSEIAVWNASTLSNLRRVCTLPAPKSSVGNANVKIVVTSIHWLGDALIASYLFHGIIIFDVARRSMSRIIQIPSIIASMSLCCDAQRAVVNDSRGGFSMHNLKNGELVRWFDSGAKQVGTAVLPSAFIHKGKALLTATTDGSVHLWDVQDGFIFSSLHHEVDAVVKCFAAHYISKKDVFLIATGVAHPPDAIGLHIWQTIESIGESRTHGLSLNRSGWLMAWRNSALICGVIGGLLVLLFSMRSEWTASSILLFLF